MRQSIQPTYDSRTTGPRYHVTDQIGDRTLTFQRPIDDPFVRHTIHIGWRDLLRGLLRRKLDVTVIVGGDPEIMYDVLELDDNTLIGGSIRRAEFNAGISRALGRFAKESEAAETEQPDIATLDGEQQP
jgi:hypothetical protein